MKKIVLMACVIAFFASCSNEDHEIDNAQNEGKGRFENTPFKWDEVYSLSKSPNEIFIGDLFATGSSTGINTRNTMILNPIGVYVGAAYPKKALPNNFDYEITDPRNPIDIIFDFNDPYIDEITKETGSVGYKKALSSAINSNNYNKQINSNKNQIEYEMVEYYSYIDIEKAFSANAGLGSIFSARVTYNSKNTKINSRTLIKLISRNFSVYMDTPVSSIGFFKNPDLNNVFYDLRHMDDAPVYIRSLTYGKVVYVAIESEYSYSQVKEAINASVKYKFASADMSNDKTVTEIFNKSSITIFAISDNASESYFLDGLVNLNPLFTVKYDSNSYGFPIYMEGRYVYDNAAYTSERTVSNNEGSTTERPNPSGVPPNGNGETPPRGENPPRGGGRGDRP